MITTSSNQNNQKNQKTQDFKVGDKVRVLRNENANISNWRVSYYGIITSIGTTHAKVFDFTKSNMNLADPSHSCEWLPYVSRAIKIEKI